MVTPKLPTVQVRDYKNDGNQYYYPEDVTSVDQKSFVYFETYNEPAITLNGVFNDILSPLLKGAKKAGNYRETEEVEKNEAKQCCGR